MKPSILCRGLGALLLLLAAAAPTLAQETAAPSPGEARLARIDALLAQRPGDGALVYYRASALLALERKDEALQTLRSLLGRRLGLLPVAGVGFDALFGDAAFEALRQQLSDEEPRTADAPQRLVVPDARLLPEGIAWDAAGWRFLLGSVAQRRIVSVVGRGRIRPFSRRGDKLDAVLGLHVDARRGELLAVSTNGFLQEAERARRNAVLRYALRGAKAGHVLQRLDAPQALQLNDVIAAADGTVWASDSEAGRLFRAAPGARQLEPFTAAGSLRGANGLAAGDDGALYVAIATGIARVDPTSAELKLLPQPADVVTAAIDGLYWHGGDLIGIQNVTNPGRVVRIALADGGQRIAGLTVLQSHHHPAWDEPTTGAIVGDALVTIANSYVSRLQPDGSIRDAQSLQPTKLLAVPLRR